MSARNYVSAREKNTNKITDYLPDINRQKFTYRISQDFPATPASTNNNGINRNINYSFEVQPYVLEQIERAGTPFSDFFSDSETGTPDIRSEESDSSAGSTFRRNTAEAARTLAAEWERIERTIYDEEGEKTSRPHVIEECKQWRALHPQLRITGKAILIPNRKSCYRQIEQEEIIAMHYSDYDTFSESEERLSQSSSDVTPENSPRNSFVEEPKLSREKVPCNYYHLDPNLPDTFGSLLQITPMHIKSPCVRKRLNSSILKSEISSSKWMRNSRPDSSVNCDRYSAKSYLSLDTRNLVLGEKDSKFNRVLTARHRDVKRLDPLYTPDLNHPTNDRFSFNNRKVSLPPLLLEEEKKNVNSAKRAQKRRTSKCQMDGVRTDKRYLN